MQPDLSIAENPRQKADKPRPQRLLRPKEAEGIRSEIAGIKALDDAPAFIRSQIQDRPAKAAQKRRLEKTLAENVPTPFTEKEIDTALRVEGELRESLIEGMCTQAEMRRRPPGAVSKHIAWEVSKKEAVLAWKNLRLRLQASDHDFGHGRQGAQVASLEPYRPFGGAQELAMDGAQIPGKSVHLRGVDSVVFSNDQLQHIKLAYPEVHKTLALLSPDQREILKAQVELDIGPLSKEELLRGAVPEEGIVGGSRPENQQEE